jgi:MFS family permease
MLTRLKHYANTYPSQYWMLISGMLVSSIGMGMIWPFLTIYMRLKLDVPLATITSLLMLDSTMSIFSAFVAGHVADRFGRKGVLALSLFMMGVVYGLMSMAGTLGAFAVLMALRGAFVPMYRIGADAMVADIIPGEGRAEAYSLLRTVNNIGIAIGPVVGGFIAAKSFTITFVICTICLVLFALMASIFMKETMPARSTRPVHSGVEGGLLKVFKDKLFMVFVAAFTMTGMANMLVFVLLPVYTKENFALPESLNGFIMSINALMVVFLQFAVTRALRRWKPLTSLAVGSVFYGLGVGSMAFWHNFAGFAAGMAIMTIGELIVAPTSTTLAAGLAPADMRGRYMSVYNLGWGISHGFGPVVGGLASDNLGPRAIWFTGLGWGLLGAVIFTWLGKKIPSGNGSTTREA